MNNKCCNSINKTYLLFNLFQPNCYVTVINKYFQCCCMLLFIWAACQEVLFQQRFSDQTKSVVGVINDCMFQFCLLLMSRSPTTPSSPAWWLQPTARLFLLWTQVLKMLSNFLVFLRGSLWVGVCMCMCACMYSVRSTLAYWEVVVKRNNHSKCRSACWNGKPHHTIPVFMQHS